MINNLKIIFIHGINNQTTNYSSKLFQKIINNCKSILASKEFSDEDINKTLSKIVQHEIIWAELSTDLTNRYLQLQYSNNYHIFWNIMKKPIDPLVIQIMQYIKDKGDKKNGHMNILRKIHNDFENIFSYEDIGFDAVNGHNTITVAHSLGSVIAFDYIMGFRKEFCLTSLNKDITVNSFVTMGSPLPIFTSAMGHTDSDMILPEHLKKWVNILSPKDAIARYIQPHFRNTKIHEYEVRTGFFPIQAHVGYWKNDYTANIIAREALQALGVKI